MEYLALKSVDYSSFGYLASLDPDYFLLERSRAQGHTEGEMAAWWLLPNFLLESWSEFSLKPYLKFWRQI